MSISRSASSLTCSPAAAPLAGYGEPTIIGSSTAMKHLRLQVQRIGPHFRTVLVRGEAGTEKELVARALHGLSPIADCPFVVAKVAMFEEALAECGPQTAASSLLLDGVSEMPLEMQDRLLRTLKENESAKSRFNASSSADSRMIASAAEDLRVLVSTGRFRQELYQRLATVEIVVPPLRERMEDLPELTQRFLGRFAPLYGRHVQEIANDAMERMQEYRWPGNVSELESVLRSCVLQCEGDVLESKHLPALGEVEEPGRSCAVAGGSARLQDVVARHVLQVLKDCGGNKLRAAEVLGISRSTLYRMLDASTFADVLR